MVKNRTVGRILFVGITILVISGACALLLFVPYPRITVTKTTTFVVERNDLEDAINAGSSLSMITQLIDSNPGLLKYISRGGLSAMHNAAAYGRADLIRLFAARGMDVNAKTVGEGATSGVRPIEFAVGAGHLEAVKALAECGARLDSTDFYGRTPLEAAEDNKRSEIADYLRHVISSRNLNDDVRAEDRKR